MRIFGLLKWGALVLCTSQALGAFGTFLPPSPAQADEEDVPSGRSFERAPDPATRGGEDAELFARAVELQGKGSYISARRAFWKLLDAFPDSEFAAEAEDRSGPNAFLGLRAMGEVGPSERRIDVALMGDGYQIEKQHTYDKHCEGQLKVLLAEPVYAAYRPYFNYWQFNLASRDKGVDEVAAELDEEMEERLRRRGRAPRKPREYETALDCKAAGPQGQVWANPRRVWHYLQYLDAHDSLAIVFAQMGQLGMGGMGIATTGPRGVVVHEFGHAFVGLLDEYANNPGPPVGAIGGPNATTDPANPPWQHFLDAKVPGVDVLEGGATFQKGVWRPAGACAMNAGGSAYCPVCREATVLRLYTYVSPIDRLFPNESEVHLPTDRALWPTFRITPMQPVTHDLEVRVVLGSAPAVTQAPGEPGYDPERDTSGLDPFEARLRKRLGDRIASRPSLPVALGQRVGATRRAGGTAHDPLPRGKDLKVRSRREQGTRVAELELPDLAPGRYLLTAIVWDPAHARKERRPWVLKDPSGLLEDRHTWTLVVPAP